MSTIRGKKHTYTEDIAIIEAYTSVSEDGIHGNDQKREVFEEKVFKNYKIAFLTAHVEAGKGTTPIPDHRTGAKICRRAKTMKAEVLKFEGIFNIIKDAKNTGDFFKID